MSLKLNKSVTQSTLESKKLSRFSTLVSTLALSFSAMVGNLDVVDAQEPAPAPVMVNQSDREYTDYTTFQLRLYADDNSEHMYEIMPFVRGKFNYLLPVDFTNAGLYIASTYFSETKKPFQLKMSRLGMGAYYQNGQMESFSQGYLLLNCLADIMFLVEFNTHLNSDGVESSFLPSVVYNNDSFYIASSGMHVDLRVNVSDFLLRTRIFDDENFSFSGGYNLKQVNGVRRQVEGGYSFELDYRKVQGENYFFLTLGLK